MANTYTSSYKYWNTYMLYLLKDFNTFYFLTLYFDIIINTNVTNILKN